MSDFYVPSDAQLRPRLAELLTRLAGVFTLGAEDKACQRSMEKLAEYDDRFLDDIGLSREQATGRKARPGWAALDWLTMPRAS